jgi:quercetin dioxygenase-like cupin family protein
MRTQHALRTRFAPVATAVRILALLVLLALVGAGTTGIAVATPAAGVSTTIISVGQIDQFRVKTSVDGHKVELATKGDSDLYVVSNVIQPGGSTGWHRHPGPSMITVKSGTITAYEGDDPSCKPTVYAAGSSFIDPGGDHVHILRNEGSVPAETIAVQLVAHGAPRRIDMPAPGNCPF